MNSHFKLFAVVAAMALLVPAGATAKRPDDKPVKGHKHGKADKGNKGKAKGKDKPKVSTVNLKGVVDSNDGTTMVVTVEKASGHGKACKGETLSFDVSSARFHTADNDASGQADAADFRVGDKVKVRAKVARTKGRKSECNLGDTSLAAKAVHNRTTPAVDEDEATDEEEAIEDGESLDEEESLEDEEDLDEGEGDYAEGDETETDVEETDEI